LNNQAFSIRSEGDTVTLWIFRSCPPSTGMLQIMPESTKYNIVPSLDATIAVIFAAFGFCKRLMIPSCARKRDYFLTSFAIFSLFVA